VSIPSDPLNAVQAEQLFSLKEWMSDISRKLDRMDVKLDGKADLSHVHQIDSRLGQVEKMLVEGQAEQRYLVPQHTRMLEDVGVLKQKAAAISQVDNYRRWVWGVAFTSLMSGSLSIVALLIK
jgi:hypothetical protein